jgi:hypothetical protein
VDAFGIALIEALVIVILMIVVFVLLAELSERKE